MTRAGRRDTYGAVKLLAPLALVAALAAQPACYASFSAFHAVHNWNGQVTHSKVANSVIHAGLWIVPVYELTLLGDLIIFNTVEFATGQPVFK